MERFFFDQDNSCHWYLVPSVHRNEWLAWRDLPEDDERSWREPEWAKRIDGHPSMYNFTDPHEH